MIIIMKIIHKIKICHIITRMDWGGAPDIVRILCQKLDLQKYEIVLIVGETIHFSKKTSDFFAGFSGSVITIPELKRDIDLRNDFMSLWSLVKILKQEKVSIVHTHTAKAGMLGRFAAKIVDVPIIIHTSHGHNFYGYFGWFFSQVIVWLERLTALFTDKIISLTELEKKDLIKYKITKDSKLEYVHTAVEVPEKVSAEDKIVCRKKINLGNDDVVVGMVGRIEPIKGVDLFIDSVLSLCSEFSRLKIVLIGEGSLRLKLEEKIKKAYYSDQIMFMGWRDDVNCLMPVFDILVLPSLNEAVGLVLIEAQAAGVPVIATRVGGIPEAIDDGKSGILVPANDLVMLTKILKKLILDQEGRKAMGEYAKEFVKNKYDPQDLASKVQIIYEELISAKKV